MRSIFIKVGIFTSSLVITLSVVEFTLRLAGIVFQTGRESTFQQTPWNRDDSLRLEREISYEKWVVTLGDSLTNGGNVPIHQSYPFQIYQRKENRLANNKIKYKILNHGWCEANTYQSLKQLKEIIEEWNRKPDVLIFLGGASDLFSPISNSEIKEIDHIISGISNHTESFIKSLRLYKIYRGISFHIRETYFQSDVDDLTEEELRPLSPVYAQIFDLFKDNKFSDGNKLIQKNFKIIGPPELDSFSSSVIDQFLVKQDRKKAIEFILDYLEEYPELFKLYGRNSLHRMVMAFSMQSEITPEFILERFKGIEKKHPEVSSTDLYKKYLLLFSDMKKQITKINQNRLSNLRKLADLCKKNGIKLIFQNYPANFTEANSALETVAEEYNLPFVDNNKVFNTMFNLGFKKQEYLAEDEHPSSKGYEVMAENVWKTLEGLKTELIVSSWDIDAYSSVLPEFQKLVKESMSIDLSIKFVDPGNDEELAQKIKKGEVHLASLSQYLFADKRFDFFNKNDLEKIRYDLIPNSKHIFSPYLELDFAKESENIYGVPLGNSSYRLAYNKKLVSSAPTTWEVLWDPANKKRFLLSSYEFEPPVYLSANSLGIPKEKWGNYKNFDTPEVRKKIAFLAKNAGTFYGEDLDLSLLDGKKYAAIIGNNLLSKTNWAFASPLEGEPSIIDYTVIPSRSPGSILERIVSYMWINKTLSPIFQKNVIVDMLGEMPVINNSSNVFSSEEVKTFNLDNPTYHLKKRFFWGARSPGTPNWIETTWGEAVRTKVD